MTALGSPGSLPPARELTLPACLLLPRALNTCWILQNNFRLVLTKTTDTWTSTVCLQVKIVLAERDVYAAEIDGKLLMKIGPGDFKPDKSVYGIGRVFASSTFSGSGTSTTTTPAAAAAQLGAGEPAQLAGPSWAPPSWEALWAPQKAAQEWLRDPLREEFGGVPAVLRTALLAWPIACAPPCSGSARPCI